MAAHINPALWTAFIALSAGCTMFCVVHLFDPPVQRPQPVFRFVVISGFISYVLPYFFTYLVIPKIGSGLTAIMFAFSPVATGLLSVVLGVRPPNKWGLIGIALGLAGALVIIFGRNSGVAVSGGMWLAVALLIPVFLGIGNVYRSMAWPTGASPRRLASFTNLAALPFLVVLTVAMTGGFDVMTLLQSPGLMLAQALVSSIMFLMFFRLQQIGGPTYLSQIGYVAAAVGLLIGVLYWGEVYPASVWIGAGIVALGIGLSTWGQAVDP